MQYVASPERYTTIIPHGVCDFIAGPIMCSASTAYTSIKQSNLKPGQWALFLGGGSGVGIQGVQLAVAMGLRPIVVDTTDERKDLSLSLGAEHFVDFLKVEDPVREVLQLTDGGVDGVFVTGMVNHTNQEQCSSIVAVQAYPQALSYLGDTVGGIVMCIGLPPTNQVGIDLAPSSLIFRNQSIKGTLVSNMADVDETLKFAQRGIQYSLLML
jgi:propanol-preferring alcohol dehydrogenase